MAMPLSPTAVLPLKSQDYATFLPKNAPQTTLTGRTFPHVGRLYTKAPSVVPRASLESMSSIITELERGKKLEKQSDKRLADTWHEIHGRHNWAGMLDPIDQFLQSELIRYGEMTQACYDAFDFDHYSRHCGSCRFNRREFFQSLGMAGNGYEVTRYLYATANVSPPSFFKKSLHSQVWSDKANWIGYVAVSDDETSKRIGRRDITVAWRGTVTKLEWVADFMVSLEPIKLEGIPCPDDTVKVETGFVNLYTDRDESCRFCKYSAREQVLTEVKRLIQQYSESGEEVSLTVTGHSLGSALATLNAYDIAETRSNVMKDGRIAPICVFSFAGPRVGNDRFKERVEKVGVKVLRVVNVYDAVPKVPGLIFNENLPAILRIMAGGYTHVGVELELDHKHSPFLKETNDVSCYHNLEAYIHLLDGFKGTKGEEFVSATGRDPALVNKSSDFLKEDLVVPPNWRQDENKGLVRNSEGRWVLPDRPNPDDHSHV